MPNESNTTLWDLVDTGSDFKSSLYTIVVPVMVCCCVMTMILNLVIVASARWCKRPMSPTLYFSISLALADAYASIILGTGLMVNSLLPAVYGTQLGMCFQLTLEVFRLGGVLVSNAHLLALATNHWIGIIRPLHYAATMTRRTAWIIIINSWIFPIVLIFLYFSSRDNVGFLSENCSEWGFLLRKTFRAVFASFFFAPLVIMTLIYTHIFCIVRSSQRDRLKYQTQNYQQLQRNVKAVVTTLLILGTYIVGWMPAILLSLIVCNDCVLHFSQVPEKVMYTLTIGVNMLIIIKAFVDPIIYALRIPDIQLALKTMRSDVFSRCFPKCGSPSVVSELQRSRSIRKQEKRIPQSEDDKPLFGDSNKDAQSIDRSLNQRNFQVMTQKNCRLHASIDKEGKISSSLEMAEFQK